MAYYENKQLLSTVGAATSNGSWVDATQYEIPYSIHFQGTGVGDTCEIRVSNDRTQPPDTDHDALFGTAVNTDQKTVSITETYRWIKVRKTAATGATTADLQAHFRR